MGNTKSRGDDKSDREREAVVLQEGMRGQSVEIVKLDPEQFKVVLLATPRES